MASEIDWFTIAGSGVSYLAVLIIGGVAAKMTVQRGSSSESPADSVMVGHRSFGWFISICTITATWIGSTATIGGAERVFTNGIVSGAILGLGFSFSLFFGGLLVADKLRSKKYVSFTQLFHDKYGKFIGCFFTIPVYTSEQLCVTGALVALGSTLSIMANIDNTIAIVVSSLVAIVYTFFGGIFAVAYTDIVQLVFIGVGLTTAIPFVLSNNEIQLNSTETLDQSLTKDALNITGVLEEIDSLLPLVFGGIAYQCYMQRLLAAKTTSIAKYGSMMSCVLCALFSSIPLVIGATARNIDWNQTMHGAIEEASDVLPLTIKYLCPHWVTFLGLGALSAAGMSSADSCMLAAASVFVTNIYKGLIRPRASDREMMWAIRCAILFVGLIGCLIAIAARSVYLTIIIASDIAYIVIFPQLICILYFSKTNSYGAIVGYLAAIVLRFGGGEPLLNLPCFIPYPGNHLDEQGQLVNVFPIKTFAMAVDFFITLALSYLTHAMHRKGIFSPRYDFAKCFQNSTKLEQNAHLKNSTPSESENVENRKHLLS